MSGLPTPALGELCLHRQSGDTAGTKAMMRDYRTMLVEARERIAKLKATGKTEEEVVALRPTADYDARFGVNERATGNFLRVVYRSLPR